MRRIVLFGFAMLVIAWAGSSVGADGSLHLAFTPSAIVGLNLPALSEGFSNNLMIDIGGLAWIDDYNTPVFKLELGLGAFAASLPAIRATAHVSFYAWKNGLISLGCGVSPIRDLRTELTYGSVCLEVEVLGITEAFGAAFGTMGVGLQIPIGYDHLLLLFYLSGGLEWYF